MPDKGADDVPVLVHVDFNLSTPAVEQHWVLIVGKSAAITSSMTRGLGSKVVSALVMATLPAGFSASGRIGG